MIVNDYKSKKNVIKNIIRKNPKLVKYITMHDIKTFYSKSQIPLFKYCEIETINRCNGTCSFCPVNRNDDPRELAKMTKELFKKIIDELAQMEYVGKLALHSNNEPFIDDRIIDFARYARIRLPQAYIFIFTNGSLLTLDKLIEIEPYLDKLIIDNYNDALELNNVPALLNEYCKTKPYLDRKIEFRLRKMNEVLSTRGGSSPNKRNTKSISCQCLLPFSQVVIRPDGKLSLCCNDALGKMTMGDVSESTLFEIWTSQKYMKIREMMRVGRKEIELCRYCDDMHRKVWSAKIGNL